MGLTRIITEAETKEEKGPPASAEAEKKTE